jgi:hypothetical protein
MDFELIQFSEEVQEQEVQEQPIEGEHEDDVVGVIKEVVNESEELPNFCPGTE